MQASRQARFRTGSARAIRNTDTVPKLLEHEYSETMWPLQQFRVRIAKTRIGGIMTSPSAPLRRSAPRNLVSIMSTVCLALAVCACSGIRIHDGETAHFLVIGIGVVSVPQPDNDDTVLSARSHVLGLSASNFPGNRLALGYSSGVFTAIPADANDVRVEVDHSLGGIISIQTDREESENR